MQLIIGRLFQNERVESPVIAQDNNWNKKTRHQAPLIALTFPLIRRAENLRSTHLLRILKRPV
jgi:hypothetical protein